MWLKKQNSSGHINPFPGLGREDYDHYKNVEYCASLPGTEVE